jgi:4-hydroxybenzoyl-CoA thioesterase
MMQSNAGMHDATTWTVDWGDCDPAGIVFYPRYFAWFDRAAHRFFEAKGLDHHTVRTT